MTVSLVDMKILDSPASTILVTNSEGTRYDIAVPFVRSEFKVPIAPKPRRPREMHCSRNEIVSLPRTTMSLVRRFGLLVRDERAMLNRHRDDCASLPREEALSLSLGFGQRWLQRSGGPQSSLTSNEAMQSTCHH